MISNDIVYEIVFYKIHEKVFYNLYMQYESCLVTLDSYFLII